MMTRLIKWAVIVALIAAMTVLAGWLGYRWGQADCAAEAAEARTEAVSEATRAAEQALYRAQDRNRVLAAQAAKRRKDLQAELRAAQSQVEAYAASQAGQRECLGQEGRDAWNKL